DQGLSITEVVLHGDVVALSCGQTDVPQWHSGDAPFGEELFGGLQNGLTGGVTAGVGPIPVGGPWQLHFVLGGLRALRTDHMGDITTDAGRYKYEASTPERPRTPSSCPKLPIRSCELCKTRRRAGAVRRRPVRPSSTAGRCRAVPR